MCEILVKLVSGSNPDPSIDAGMFKANDVVSVEEDDHDWGKGILYSSDFNILKYPGVPAADKEYLVQQHKQGITHSSALKIPELRYLAINNTQKVKAIRRFAIDATGVEIDKGKYNGI